MEKINDFSPKIIGRSILLPVTSGGGKISDIPLGPANPKIKICLFYLSNWTLIYTLFHPYLYFIPLLFRQYANLFVNHLLVSLSSH